MAEFGANHPCFKADGAAAGIVLGKLVSANLTVNLASGELYADDSLAEQVSEFASGSIAMETDDMTDDKSSIVYGCKVSNGVVTYNTGDNAPSGCLAYYKAVMRNRKKYYKAYFYPVVRAALGNDNAQTRGSSITFTPVSTTFTVFADGSGDWRKTRTFDDAASAAAWCESQCSVASYYAVTVSAQGTGSGKSVDKLGTYYVASGSDFALAIEGYASVTAAYDNGTAVTATVTGGDGTYKLTAVSADHTIAIVF